MQEKRPIAQFYTFVRITSVMLLTSAMTSSVFAQAANDPPSIKTSTLQADALDQTQQAEISKWVQHWCDSLAKATSIDRVIKCRTALLRPLTNTLAKATPKAAVSKALAKGLAGAIDAKAPVPVRLSAFIVVAQSTTTDVQPLVLKGVADPNPGVRYWAGRAIHFIADRQREGGQAGFTAAQETALLAALNKAAAGEKYSHVLEQVFEAMGKLKIPAAQTALLAGLAKRVAVHKASVQESIRADAKALAGVRQRLVFKIAQGGDADGQFRELIALSGRYLMVIATQIAGNKVAGDIRPAADEAIFAIDEILNNALDHFDKDFKAKDERPKLVGAAVGPAALRLAAIQWVGVKQGGQELKGILQNAKIAIPLDKVQP